jgi:predicted N-formylglutamate amidohydrolase
VGDRRSSSSPTTPGDICLGVSKWLDAVVIRQNYSRLAIDCNRIPGSETSIVELSELTTIPGNIGLSKTQIETRIRKIFQPYHDRIRVNRIGGDKPTSDGRR